MTDATGNYTFANLGPGTYRVREVQPAGSTQTTANPANVDYLFYVVKPNTCGEHAFSSTDAQFQEDVNRYNAEREKAGGKSPTKC